MEIIYIKLLSIEYVHRRRRRKTRECAVEAQPGTQCSVRRIKQKDKVGNKVREERG